LIELDNPVNNVFLDVLLRTLLNQILVVRGGQVSLIEDEGALKDYGYEGRELVLEDLTLYRPVGLVEISQELRKTLNQMIPLSLPQVYVDVLLVIQLPRLGLHFNILEFLWPTHELSESHVCLLYFYLLLLFIYSSCRSTLRGTHIEAKVLQVH